MFLDIYRLLWLVYRHGWHRCVFINEHSVASANYRVRLSSWTFLVSCVLLLSLFLTSTSLFHRGKTLKIVSKTVFVEGLIRSARSEVSDSMNGLPTHFCMYLTNALHRHSSITQLRDLHTNLLYVSAIHSTIAAGSKTTALRKSNKERAKL